MRRMLPLLLLVLVPAPTGLANGCPVPCSGQVASPRSERLLYVQPNGEAGPLVAYDTRTGAKRFTLPAGRSSADGRLHVTARRGGGSTLLRTYSVADGHPIGAFLVPGGYELAGVSPNAAWL